MLCQLESSYQITNYQSTCHNIPQNLNPHPHCKNLKSHTPQAAILILKFHLLLHGLSHITVTRLHEIQNGHSPISGCISFCLPDELSAGKQFLSHDITAYQHTKTLTRYPNIISAKKLFTLPPKFHTSVINFLKY